MPFSRLFSAVIYYRSLLTRSSIFCGLSLFSFFLFIIIVIYADLCTTVKVLY